MSKEEGIPLNAQVELLPGKEAVYKKAVAGSRGWVRDKREDDFGYPQVFIEWDKDHWAYTGETDGWSFESHFQVVKDVEDKDEFQEAIAKARGRMNAEDNDRIERYLDALQEGVQAALEADGFMLLTISSVRDSGLADLALVPSIHSAVLNELAVIVLEAQIMDLASASYQSMAMREMQKLLKDDDDDESGR